MVTKLLHVVSMSALALIAQSNVCQAGTRAPASPSAQPKPMERDVAPHSDADWSDADRDAVTVVYEVPWFTIDGGGGVSTGGIYSVSGTFAQHDVACEARAGSFVVTGGYWEGGDFAPPCLADLNSDRLVNTADLVRFLGAFGHAVSPGSGGDMNGDGAVNTSDLTRFLGAFGSACASCG